MEAGTVQQIQGLSRMTVDELREKYLEVFGEETRSYHKAFLRKRIAWRLQALALRATSRTGPGGAPGNWPTMRI